ncbi:hypothetical protein NQ314_013961 [Rhamnusium bicolor]|uniref:ATP-dependent DNA helicase n=1 Tax=Rhamnusium bicolor TaxID=1586634 RepID=A0AAV8X3J3_9CUCU|nr:hypothetical protein NQ314_013961 [Rhamnusium bicolor]
MPKKARKNLTKRKGTKKTGNAAKTSSIRSDTPNAIDHLSLDTMMEDVPSAVGPTAPKRIKILQNILIVAAAAPPPPPIPGRDDNNGPSSIRSEKGKKRIGYYCPKYPVEVAPRSDDMPLKRYNCIQQAVKLIIDNINNNRDRTSEILEELTLQNHGPLIKKMVDLFPMTKYERDAAGPSLAEFLFSQEHCENVVKQQHSSDGPGMPQPPTADVAQQIIVDVMIHHSAASQIDVVRSQSCPRPQTAIPQLSKDLDAIMLDPSEEKNDRNPVRIPTTVADPPRRDENNDMDIDGILLDVQNVIRQDERERERAAIREDWRAIADLQRVVNRERDPINTYLMATERRLRGNNSSYLGPLTLMCRFCSALHFRAELTTRGDYIKCCQNNKVILPAFRPMPDLLRNLFNRTHPQSTNFKQNVLRYNYAFQFVSLEAKLRQLPRGRAPPVYTIQGKVYHHLSDINVNDPVQRYGPVYFLTPEEALHHRQQNVNNNNDLLPQTIELIEDLLRNVNPYAQAYMHLRHRYDLEVETIERLRADAVRLRLDAPPLRMPLVTLELLQVRGANNRQFDLPVIPEVAAVYNSNIDHPPAPGLKVYVRNEPSRFKTISQESELLDPLVFPLLFPLGERGWCIGMPHNHGQRNITLCEYYAYRLAIRDNEQRFKYGGKLTQQYIVAAYIKIEAYRMKYILNNQERLRADQYVGLADYLNRRINDDDEAATLGRMIILPTTYIGSPRHQQQLFQDAMAVVARHGSPSLFITMTTNPKWREITENIPRGDQTNDHPMLIAEIPDRNVEPDLYDIVTRNMVHGPCGVLNPNCPCMVDGKCSKGYPKPFIAETTIDENGRMTYRRRNNGATIIFTSSTGEQHMLDNRWIVPYNPYALLTYNCHINVEACATVKSVKYLYKYFFKGTDHALVRINRQVDYNEVEVFLNARYMSPPEASWHINQFPLHKNTHTIIRLCVHMPQRQIVLFQPGLEVEALQRNEVTQLTAWFLLNQIDADANRYLYTDIPYHYVWQTAQRRWKRRIRGADKIIVRMYSISVRRQELYYLRLLLLHVRGARSYEDVRTVDGRVYDTFLEACQIRNLLADDAEWIRALQEANARHMPHHMRQMFAYMLLYCEITDKTALWERFREAFTEDHTRHGIDQEEAVRRALSSIQTVLLLHRTRLSDFGLPEPAFMDNDDDTTQCGVRSAGSGKSFLFQTLISVLRGEDTPLIAMAPTGLAASLLKGGRTLHSRFKIPLDVNETTTTGVSPTSTDGRLIAAAKLIIIDEISMVNKTIFDLVERGLRDISTDNRPFANKAVIIAGDFRQTLPVLLNANRQTIVDSCVKGSRHFHAFQRHDLRVNVRARGDEQHFSAWLIELGNGTLPPLRRTLYGNIIKIPSQCIVSDKKALIDFCFGDLIINSNNNNKRCRSTKQSDTDPPQQYLSRSQRRDRRQASGSLQDLLQRRQRGPNG